MLNQSIQQISDERKEQTFYLWSPDSLTATQFQFISSSYFSALPNQSRVGLYFKFSRNLCLCWSSRVCTSFLAFSTGPLQSEDLEESPKLYRLLHRCPPFCFTCVTADRWSIECTQFIYIFMFKKQRKLCYKNSGVKSWNKLVFEYNRNIILTYNN